MEASSTQGAEDPLLGQQQQQRRGGGGGGSSSSDDDDRRRAAMFSLNYLRSMRNLQNMNRAFKSERRRRSTGSGSFRKLMMPHAQPAQRTVSERTPLNVSNIYIYIYISVARERRETTTPVCVRTYSSYQSRLSHTRYITSTPQSLSFLFFSSLHSAWRSL